MWRTQDEIQYVFKGLQMRKFLLPILLATISHISNSQTILSSTTLYENGDKLSYALKMAGSSKITKIDYYFTDVTENYLVGFQTINNKITQVRTKEYGTATNDLCWGNSQKCSFDPPMKLFDKNIKVGDEWVNKFKVKGEEFTSNVTQEVKVEKQEKIKINLGEFDTIKVVAKGKFNGSTIRNETYSGSDIHEMWIGNINEKLVLIKAEYSNSFREKWTAELDALPKTEKKSVEDLRTADKSPDQKQKPAVYEKNSPQKQKELIALAGDPDSDGVFNIDIKLDAPIASLKINGREEGSRDDGKFSIKRVAKIGKDNQYDIEVIDAYGDKYTKKIQVTRKLAEKKSDQISLNPAAIRKNIPKDAVAIIIGIQNYKRVTKADFANSDAQVFYDYAVRALGVKEENIKLLLDAEAEDIEIYRAFKNWLPLKVKKNKTDVYVFFSGHGLPSEDGKSLFFLPYGVDKDFIDKSAVSQKEIVAALQASQPKSVTMFIDSCYSGQARTGETLLAEARPVSVKVKEAVFPPEFVVLSASAPDQISSSSSDLKHGIFSFYLMKAMEGDADENKDGKITVGELQNYLADTVARQAMGMNRKQQPQLIGDPNRILVGP
jgi:hypothetical protein